MAACSSSAACRCGRRAHGDRPAREDEGLAMPVGSIRAFSAPAPMLYRKSVTYLPRSRMLATRSSSSLSCRR
eukprot:scaffold70920_cov69-Phaeocystis_antarctica.AAC.3